MVATDRSLAEIAFTLAEAERTAAQLNGLLGVTDPNLSDMGLGSMMIELMARACRAVGADVAVLHLLDDARRLQVRAAHGCAVDLATEPEMGEGPIGHVAATGKPLRFERVGKNAPAPPGVAEGVRSVLAVPLRSADRVIGVLHVGTEVVHRFDDDEVLVLSTAADRVAMALERARLFESEQRARVLADEALRARDDFLSMASHELKTPMTSISLLVEGLLRGISTSLSEPEVRQRLESIEHQIMQLGDLTERLLDVSRMNATGVGLRLDVVDLAAVARDAVARVSGDPRLAGSEVSLHAETPVIGRWDRQRCEQMVVNLLSNAATFGQRRPIEVDVSEDGEHARLTVRDHGVGIAAERQRFIFDLYARGDTSAHVAGLGLGLWVVERIAGALGGSVCVESAIGEGSAFTVELPIRGPMSDVGARASAL